MAILWVAQSLDIHGDETQILYYIRHDLDAELSFRVVIDSIAIEYRTHTIGIDFSDGCLIVIYVTYETQIEVRVSLTLT